MPASNFAGGENTSYTVHSQHCLRHKTENKAKIGLNFFRSI